MYTPGQRTVILLRHGESVSTSIMSDLQLTDTGAVQAQAASAHLLDLLRSTSTRLDTVLMSPADRAVMSYDQSLLPLCNLINNQQLDASTEGREGEGPREGKRKGTDTASDSGAGATHQPRVLTTSALNTTSRLVRNTIPSILWPIFGDPIKALWDRAEMAWRAVLGEGGQDRGGTTLCVSHSAVIQAMLCTALGVGVSGWRLFQVLSISKPMLHHPHPSDPLNHVLLSTPSPCYRYLMHPSPSSLSPRRQEAGGDSHP